MKTLWCRTALFIAMAGVMSPLQAATIFTESMGSVSSTTTLATHVSNEGFDNDSLTFTAGGLGLSDVRSTSPSTNAYTGASGGANIFFTSTTPARGFAIGGINTSNFTSLSLSYGIRKEATDSQYDLHYSTDGGTNWTAVSGVPALPSGTGWTHVSGVALPVAAQVANLSLRWSRPAGAGAIRLDDVVLTGTPVPVTFTLAPGALSFTQVDADNGPFTQGITVTTSVGAPDVQLALASTSGSGTITLLSPTLPVTIAGNGGQQVLTFQYAPTDNDGATASTTFSFTSDGTPAAFNVIVTGSTVTAITIHALRALGESDPIDASIRYLITGYVSHNLLNLPRYSMGVQDRIDGDAATRGIVVDDPTGVGSGNSAPPTPGSEVRLIGTLGRFRGLVQLTPDVAYAITNAPVSITPLALINSTGLGDATEGVLVSIPQVVIPAATYTETGAGLNIGADDTANGGGAFTTRLGSGSGISYISNGGARLVTGMGGQFSTATGTGPATGGDGWQLFPRSASDLPVEISALSLE